MADARIYGALVFILVVLSVSAALIAAAFNQQIQQQNSQIASLNSQISNLNANISNLEAATLIGSFKMASAGCYYCSVSGSFANLGTQTAHSASIVFTFYTGSDKTGQVVCSATYVIGDMLGRTVSILPSTSCTATSNNYANSVDYVFQWS